MEYDRSMFAKHSLKIIWKECKWWMKWSGIFLLAFYMFPLTFLLLLMAAIVNLTKDKEAYNKAGAALEPEVLSVLIGMIILFVILWSIVLGYYLIQWLKKEVPIFLANSKKTVEKSIEEELKNLKCPSCESQIAKKDPFCSNCGKQLITKKEKQKDSYVWHYNG